MQIFVKVKTGAKQEKIEKLDDTHFIISVKDRPISGKANSAVIKALAKFLGVAQSRINIVRGLTSRNKVLEVI